MEIISKNLGKMLMLTEPDQHIETDNWIILTFFSKSEAKDYLYEIKCINCVIIMKSIGDFFVIKKEEMIKTNKGFIYEGNVWDVNTSDIVGFLAKDDFLYATHWDGFVSKFDVDNMNLVNQVFTK